MYPSRPEAELTSFGSPGQGSTIHLATELFASMAAIKMNHVPYKGAGTALTETIAGQIDVYFSSIPPFPT